MIARLAESIDVLFNQGNYAAVALAGDSEKWQTFAALGLVGKTSQAIGGLKRFDSPEASFYSAVASWIDGDNERAEYILKNIQTPHARNLLYLIQKPQINVLGQFAQSHGDILTGGAQDKKFNIQNITFNPCDLQNKLYIDIHKYYNHKYPHDLYICQGWGQIPRNLQELPCPLIGQTGDHDVHIQNFYPWYQLFDEFIVNDPTEWLDISGAVNVPVSIFPKAYGVTPSTPPTPNRSRDIDVFVSGSWGTTFHPDKMSVVCQVLSSIQEYKVIIVNGYLTHSEYYRLLERSKVSFTYVRYPYALPTRGLDAIAMGCACVVQNGSVLSLFLGEDEGVMTYDVKANNLAEVIRKILTEWPEFERKAQRGAEAIRKEFALARCASQYLRFAVFLAAKPRNRHKKKSTDHLVYKRTSIHCNYSAPDEGDVLADRTILHLQSRLQEEQTSHIFIDMARVLVMEYIKHWTTVDENNKDLLNEIKDIYETGMARFPGSLVLRFNFVRVLFHFGGTEEINYAMQLAKEAVNMPSSEWNIDIMDDIFPHDFWHTFFNYRSYFDLIMKYFRDKIDPSKELYHLIIASLHYYIGKGLNDLYHFKQSIAFDPEFVCYSFFYAQHLVKLGKNHEDYETAGELFLKLVKDSIFFVESYEYLNYLRDNKLFFSQEFEKLSPQIKQSILNYIVICEFFSTEILEQVVPVKNRYNLERSNPENGIAVKNYQVESKEAKDYNYQCNKKDIKVSFIIPVFNQIFFAQQCINRLKLMLSDINYEIILVDNGSLSRNITYLTLDNNVKLLQSRHSDPTLFKFYNEGSSIARGAYIVFMKCSTIPQAEFLKALVDDALTHPEAGIIGSKIISLSKKIHHTGIVYSRSSNTPCPAYSGVESDLRVVNYRREVQGVSASGMLLRRNLFETVNGFDEKYLAYFGDFDLCLRVHEEGYRIVYQPEAVLYYWGGEMMPYFTHVSEDVKYLNEKWKDKSLVDIDLFYFNDGYLFKYDRAKPQEARLLPFSTSSEKKQWRIVADFQSTAQLSGIQAAKPLLFKVESWPDDVGVLEWGGKMCELAGIPEQAKLFHRKIHNISNDLQRAER